MHVGLVLGGDPPTPSELGLLADCDQIIAADSGADALRAHGTPPSLVVGDLDSLQEATLAWLEDQRVRLERHPVDKDATDGELALDACLRLQPARIMVLGGHGGRSGMFLGNLKLLRRAAEAGADAVMVGAGERIRYCATSLRLAARDGRAVDLVPVGEARVRLTGLRWGGDVALDATSGRGLSNRIQDDTATVDVLQGAVIVVQAA